MNKITVSIIVLAVLVGIGIVTTDANAGDHLITRTDNSLFHNYYVSPGHPNQIGAKLYVSPVPVPAHVGHTYYTYPPLMPHEFLYKHSRTYWRHNPCGNSSRTKVHWW